MNKEDKQRLAEKIQEEFEKQCDKYDEWCTKCPYAKDGVHCEIEFTLSYLNKRKWLKGNKE